MYKKQGEVISLNKGNQTCSKLDLKHGFQFRAFATGGLLFGSVPIVCGGFDQTGTTFGLRASSECKTYIVPFGKTTNMLKDRANAASIVIGPYDNILFVTGGTTDLLDNNNYDHYS